MTLLKQNEPVRLDPGRLEDLYMQLGHHAAENVVCRALEELAARLAHVEKSFREGKTKEVCKNSRGLGAIAEQLGMSMLSTVARDVVACAETGDPVALAATLARLLRIGERSLTEIWDVQEY